MTSIPIDAGADYDYIVVGSGAGGGPLAANLATSGYRVLLIEAGSDPQQRNKHGLTPLDCATGGAQGQWQRFSNASLEDWRRCVELLRS